MKKDERRGLPAPSLSEADLRILTARYHEIRTRAFANAVEAQAAMGDVLLEGQAGLLYGRFELWIGDDLGMKPRTAYRLIRVAELARNHPRHFDKLKAHGPTRVGDIASLPEPALTRILDRGVTKLVELGTVALRERLASHRAKPKTINARARATAATSAARKSLDRLRSLEGRWKRVPEDVVTELAVALRELCAYASRAPWKD